MLLSPSFAVNIELWNFLIRNKDTITFFIALFGFILSFGQLIYGLYRRNLKLSLEIQTVERTSVRVSDDKLNPTKEIYIFFATFINKSSLPTVITKIFVYDNNGNKYPCTLKKKWIGEQYYPKFDRTDIPCTERALSADFPLCIDAVQAKNEAIEFTLPENTQIIKNDSVRFKVVTIRKSKFYTLKCPQTFSSSLSV